MPVHEDYGHLRDGTTLPEEDVGNLYLEGVSIGADGVQVEPLQRGAPERLESAGGILYRESGYGLGVMIREP